MLLIFKRLLSFQIVQNKHKRAAHHTFFRFLPTKESCYPKSISLTDEGSTQCTLKRGKKCYNTIVLTQWIRMWPINSSFNWQRKHLVAKDHPFLYKWSKIKTFVQVASQAKKLTFGGTKSSKSHLQETKLYYLALKPSEGL